MKPLLNHEIGQLTQIDAPNFTMLEGADCTVGAKFEVKYEFEEFCRLQIGSKWFLVSEAKPWFWNANGQFTIRLYGWDLPFSFSVGSQTT